MLYKNTKAMVGSPDRDTDFYVVARVLQGDTLAPYLFIICQDYVLQTSIDLIKQNGFTLKRLEADDILQKLTDTNYVDYIVLLANTTAVAESLLHSLEQGAGGIGLSENANKIEYMCFKREPSSLEMASM